MAVSMCKLLFVYVCMCSMCVVCVQVRAGWHVHVYADECGCEYGCVWVRVHAFVGVCVCA